MSGQFLDGPRRRPTHRQVRTERVPQDVNARLARCARRAARRTSHCTTFCVSGSPFSSQSTRGPRRCRRLPQRLRQSPCQRHVPKPSALRRPSRGPSTPNAPRSVAVWRGRRRVHSSAMISPHRSPASPPSSTTRTSPAHRSCATSTSRSYSSKSWKLASPFGAFSSLIAHGTRVDHAPFDCRLQHHVQHRQHVVDGLRCPFRKCRLQPLDVFGRDLVQSLVAQRRQRDARAGSSPSRRCRSASAGSPSRIRRGIAGRTLSTSVSSERPPSAGFGLPWTSSTRSRDSAHFCAACLLDAAAFLRSRITLPSGSWTLMSTSQPPFTYGRTVTLIAVTPSATARASGRATLTVLPSGSRHGGGCESHLAVACVRAVARRSRRAFEVVSPASHRFLIHGEQPSAPGHRPRIGSRGLLRVTCAAPVDTRPAKNAARSVYGHRRKVMHYQQFASASRDEKSDHKRLADFLMPAAEGDHSSRELHPP